MGIRAYLPSTRFISLSISLLLSAGLIAGAQYYVSPHPSGTATLAVAAGQTAAENWQSQFPAASSSQGSSLNNQAQQLIAEATSTNLTAAVGRALLINTSAAVGQGLGSNVNTQSDIVSQALSQIQNTQQKPDVFALGDIPTEGNSSTALHTFGNSFVEALSAHPRATYLYTMTNVGLAVDNNSPTTLAKLPAVEKAYRALASAIVHIRTPASLASLSLEIANNDEHMADAIVDMQQVTSDPMLGMAGIETYTTFYNSNLGVLTQIAQALQNDGILFSKSEPGGEWSTFLSAQLQQQSQTTPSSSQIP